MPFQKKSLKHAEFNDFLTCETDSQFEIRQEVNLHNFRVDISDRFCRVPRINITNARIKKKRGALIYIKNINF